MVCSKEVATQGERGERLANNGECGEGRKDKAKEGDKLSALDEVRQGRMMLDGEGCGEGSWEGEKQERT